MTISEDLIAITEAIEVAYQELTPIQVAIVKIDYKKSTAYDALDDRADAIRSKQDDLYPILFSRTVDYDMGRREETLMTDEAIAAMKETYYNILDVAHGTEQEKANAYSELVLQAQESYQQLSADIAEIKEEMRVLEEE